MHRDILADHPEFAATPGILKNIERVVAAAEAVSGDHDHALEWLTKADPLPIGFTSGRFVKSVTL